MTSININDNVFAKFQEITSNKQVTKQELEDLKKEITADGKIDASEQSLLDMFAGKVEDNVEIKTTSKTSPAKTVFNPGSLTFDAVILRDRLDEIKPDELGMTDIKDLLSLKKDMVNLDPMPIELMDRLDKLFPQIIDNEVVKLEKIKDTNPDKYREGLVKLAEFAVNDICGDTEKAVAVEKKFSDSIKEEIDKFPLREDNLPQYLHLLEISGTAIVEDGVLAEGLKKLDRILPGIMENQNGKVIIDLGKIGGAGQKQYDRFVQYSSQEFASVRDKLFVEIDGKYFSQTEINNNRELINHIKTGDKIVFLPSGGRP